MRSGRALATAGIGAGQLVLVAGLFAPWLTSGRVQRNSFRAAGVLRTLPDVSRPGAAFLRVWPVVVAVAAVAVALLALGVVRFGSALAVLVALVAGATAVSVLADRGQGVVHAARTGPVITLVGAAVTCVAVVTLIMHNRTSLPSGRPAR